MVVVNAAPLAFSIPDRHGVATLVPPNTIQPFMPAYEVLSYTETPVLGSASEARSGTPRWAPVMATWACQEGLGT